MFIILDEHRTRGKSSDRHFNFAALVEQIQKILYSTKISFSYSNRYRIFIFVGYNGNYFCVKKKMKNESVW